MSAAGDSSFYRDKIVLAPMVRAGRTPLRLLSLKYGADLAYTEEIVDQKLLSCKRVQNGMLYLLICVCKSNFLLYILGTIDYTLEDDVVLRIAPKQEKCVLQIGTNEASRAAEIVKLVGKDVAAIDVNMGCPKPFSVHQGMGAALLTQTDKVKEILTSMVAVSTVPISCKIRVLDDPSMTLNLAREIEKCGVAALGVHGRRRDERDPHRCRTEEIREVARVTDLPIIANGGSGEIRSYDDILKFRDETTASSVMLARRGLQTPSVFRKEGVLSIEEQVKDFLTLACEYDENYTMTKYVVQRILGGEQDRDPRGRATVAAASVMEICRAWGVESVYEENKVRQTRLKHKRKHAEETVNGMAFIDVTFPLKKLREPKNMNFSPKTFLFDYCKEAHLDRPKYTTEQRAVDKKFVGTVEVAGKKFCSRMGQPNIKMAEQVAALAGIIGLEQRHRLKGEWDEE